MLLRRIIETDNASTTLLIRLMVGLVFLSEGIQRFLFPALRGAGRFETIGLPGADTLGTLVGAFEILSGVLILLGLMTRLAVIPSIVIITIAISTTKVDILAERGIWEMLHAIRIDWAMLLGCFFLMVKGGGFWSLDRKLNNLLPGSE